MTSALPTWWVLRVGAVAVVLVGIWAGRYQTTAIIKTSPHDQKEACPINQPPKTPEQLNACVANLTFNPIEAVGDEQPLLVVAQTPGPDCPGISGAQVSCRYGPLAKIEPDTNAYNLDEKQLGEGRIIARLSIVPGQREDYRKLALVRDHVTYWWVQKVPGRPDNDAGRSVYITEVNGSLKTKEYRLQYTPHYEGFNQSVARWVWSPKDEKTQGSCGQGCCH